MKANQLKRTARFQPFTWFKNCWHAGMKSISFQAVKDGNGYVRSTFVAGDTTEAGRPSKSGLVTAAVLLALTATFVCLMLLGK